MDDIKNEIADLMHDDKINKKEVILSNGDKWTAAYQESSRKSTDLKLLMEVVGPVKYSEIVSSTSSVFLVIRKSKKSKKSNKTQESPIDDDNIIPIIPDGMILS